MIARLPERKLPPEFGVKFLGKIDAPGTDFDVVYDLADSLAHVPDRLRGRAQWHPRGWPLVVGAVAAMVATGGTGIAAIVTLLIFQISTLPNSPLPDLDEECYARPKNGGFVAIQITEPDGRRSQYREADWARHFAVPRVQIAGVKAARVVGETLAAERDSISRSDLRRLARMFRRLALDAQISERSLSSLARIAVATLFGEVQCSSAGVGAGVQSPQELNPGRDGGGESGGGPAQEQEPGPGPVPDPEETDPVPDSGRTIPVPTFDKTIEIDVEDTEITYESSTISSDALLSLREALEALNESADGTQKQPEFSDAIGGIESELLEGPTDPTDPAPSTDPGGTPEGGSPSPDTSSFETRESRQALTQQLEAAIADLLALDFPVSEGKGPEWGVATGFGIQVSGFVEADVGLPATVTVIQQAESRANSPVTDDLYVADVMINGEQVTLAQIRPPTSTAFEGTIQTTLPADGVISCAYAPIGNYGWVLIEVTYRDSSGELLSNAKRFHVEGPYEIEARDAEAARQQEHSREFRAAARAVRRAGAAIDLVVIGLDQLATVAGSGESIPFFGLISAAAELGIVTAKNALAAASVLLATGWAEAEDLWEEANDETQRVNLERAELLPEEGEPDMREVRH